MPDSQHNFAWFFDHRRGTTELAELRSSLTKKLVVDLTTACTLPSGPQPASDARGYRVMFDGGTGRIEFFCPEPGAKNTAAMDTFVAAVEGLSSKIQAAANHDRFHVIVVDKSDQVRQPQ